MPVMQFKALWKLPEHCLYRMHALKELSLKSNKLRELPQSLGLLCSLEVLYLQDTKSVATVPDIVALAFLREDNELEGLPASLEELKQLRMLWLEDNRLSSLPWTCTQPTSLPALQLVKLQKAVPYDAAPRLLETLEQPLLRPLEAPSSPVVRGECRTFLFRKHVLATTQLTLPQGDLDASIKVDDAPVVKVYRQADPSTWKELRVPRAFRAGCEDCTKACTLDALLQWLSKQLQDHVNRIGVVVEQKDQDLVCFEGEEPNSNVVKEIKSC
eukprot:g12659.t1